MRKPRLSEVIVGLAVAASVGAIVSQVAPHARGTNVKYNICHHDEGVTATYELLNLPPQAILDAHINHQHNLDIIPEFTTRDGATYGPQGDQSILKNGCVVPPATTVAETTTTVPQEDTTLPTVPDTTIPPPTTVATDTSVAQTPTTNNTPTPQVQAETTTPGVLPPTK